MLRASSNSYDIIHKQIQHLAFIVNTGRRGTEEDVTTLISEQSKVMVGSWYLALGQIKVMGGGCGGRRSNFI